METKTNGCGRINKGIGAGTKKAFKILTFLSI